MKGRIKHVFPGGNTPRGFFSYYDYVIAPDANRIFILKGGPGVGKSTFMRKIGEVMIEQGYDVEYHHCSSDNSSLDGLVIPSLQIAFIDGTSPHIVDPKNPGCVDEIIHLGDFWDESKMIKNKQQVMACNKEISKQFARAYRVLSAAKSIYDDWEMINVEAMDFAEANQKAHTLQTKIFSGATSVGNGKIRKLFASAITPEGPINYLASIIGQYSNLYIINGDPGTGKSTLLQKMMDIAVAKGFSVEGYYCPLSPDKLEHLIIPGLNTALTTSVPPHTVNLAPTATIVNMGECQSQGVLDRYGQELAYNRKTFWELFHKAITYIKRAKALHDELETYYVPNMNFAAVQSVWEKTLERVLTYAKQVPNN